MHVLIVEDDPHERQAIADAFDAGGFDVEVAENGREALKSVRARRPDVIILDLRMPVMDGYTFLERLQKDSVLCDIPVMVCTGAPYDARLSKAAAFVKKPCRAQDLVDRARTWASAASG